MSTVAGLVATRLPLGPAPVVDPFDLAGPDGIVFASADRTLVGLGRAAAIPLPHGLDVPGELADAVRALAGVPCDDRLTAAQGAGGRGVMAFGALPFDRSAPAALTVPELLVAIEPSGGHWVTVVAPDRTRLPANADEVRARLEARARLGTRPETRPGAGEHGARRRDGAGSGTGPWVTSFPAGEAFEAMVAEALEAIRTTALSKVVLARQVELTFADAVGIVEVLRRWHRLEPDCTVFSLPGTDARFVGASPELLVERSGLTVHSRPLAGSTDRTPGSGPDRPGAELLRSAKDNDEHRLVVQAVAEQLRPLCERLIEPPAPELVHLHNLVHLATSLTGTLQPGPAGPVPSALDLVAALHPTPAVGGVPTGAARSLIGRLEPEPRGHYAGPVGYLEANGDGKWMVGIRSASVRGRTVRLAAGAGIVSGSEPRRELAETVLKFDAVLGALAPGLRLGAGTGRLEPVA